jgi:vesicle transport through interaction with t-SNAREs 1
MELEIRSLAGEEKSKYQTRLQSYQSQVQTLQRDLVGAVCGELVAAFVVFWSCFNVLNQFLIQKTVRSGNSDDHNRDALLSADDPFVPSDDQRALLLENTERIDRTTYRLEQGYRAALETEQIGATVLSNLGSQKESLNKTRHRLTEMEEDLGRSSRVLTTMIRRVIQNRVVIVGLMAFLVIAIGICIYLTVHRT